MVCSSCSQPLSEGATFLLLLRARGPLEQRRGAAGRHRALRRPRRVHGAVGASRSRAGQASARRDVSAVDRRDRTVRWARRQGARRWDPRALRCPGRARGRPGSSCSGCDRNAPCHRRIRCRADRSGPAAAVADRDQHRRSRRRDLVGNRRLHRDGRRRECRLTAADDGASGRDVSRSVDRGAAVAGDRAGPGRRRRGPWPRADRGGVAGDRQSGSHPDDRVPHDLPFVGRATQRELLASVMGLVAGGPRCGRVRDRAMPEAGRRGSSTKPLPSSRVAMSWCSRACARPTARPTSGRRSRPRCSS